MALIPASDSTTFVLRRNTWNLPSQRWAVPRAKGALSASAQGQATINTDVNARMARETSCDHHQAPAAKANVMTASVKPRLNRLSSVLRLLSRLLANVS
jgi:hypothetical protein